MAHNYILRVTAGPGYDLATHAEVAVNAPRPLRLSTPLADVALSVRVQRYRGLPRGSPASSPYFEAEPHRSGGDQYGIAIEFTPKAPAGGGGGEETEEEEEGADGEGQKKKMKKKRQGISGADLQFGNDFDHPIRDRLPPGFGTAMNIVKWWIDPGLEGDVHADKPYLYGPALSSFNAVHVGPPAFDEARGGLWVDEGGDAAGLKSREAAGAPADRKARMKWALQASSKDRWVWEYGTTYGLDFYNAYLDFNDFALRLPGFTLPIMKYWDGQGLRPPKRSHDLRYVLRHRGTGETYLVIFFTLYLKEDVNEDGSLKPAALASTGKQDPDRAVAHGGHGKDTDGAQQHGPHEDIDEQKVLEAARGHFGERHGEEDKDMGPVETSADDVD